jgi:hypothetical protein
MFEEWVMWVVDVSFWFGAVVVVVDVVSEERKVPKELVRVEESGMKTGVWD